MQDPSAQARAAQVEERSLLRQRGAVAPILEVTQMRQLTFKNEKRVGTRGRHNDTFTVVKFASSFYVR